MHDATVTCPDLTTFTGLPDLGVEVTGQLLEPDHAVLACRVTHQPLRPPHVVARPPALRGALVPSAAGDPVGEAVLGS